MENRGIYISTFIGEPVSENPTKQERFLDESNTNQSLKFFACICPSYGGLITASEITLEEGFNC